MSIRRMLPLVMFGYNVFATRSGFVENFVKHRVQRVWVNPYELNMATNVFLLHSFLGVEIDKDKSRSVVS